MTLGVVCVTAVRSFIKPRSAACCDVCCCDVRPWLVGHTSLSAGERFFASVIRLCSSVCSVSISWRSRLDDMAAMEGELTRYIRCYCCYFHLLKEVSSIKLLMIGDDLFNRSITLIELS